MTRYLRLRRRHWVLASLSLIAILAHTCTTFRMTDREWQNELTMGGHATMTIDTYRIEGHTIHYVHVGAATLPLVVWLHGTPGSSSAFVRYMRDTALTRHVQQVAVDRPGFGYSDFGRSVPSLAEQSALLRPLLDRFPQASSVWLAGHSFGGPVAARMAMDFGDRIDGLFLLAPSIDPALEPYEWYREPMNWPAVRWLIPATFRVSNEEILPVKGQLTEMLPLWPRITAPTVVMQGRRDVLVPAANADFALERLINSDTVRVDWLPEANHFFLWTQYDRVCAQLLDAIGTMTPTRSTQ